MYNMSYMKTRKEQKQKNKANFFIGYPIKKITKKKRDSKAKLIHSVVGHAHIMYNALYGFFFQVHPSSPHPYTQDNLHRDELESSIFYMK